MTLLHLTVAILAGQTALMDAPDAQHGREVHAAQQSSASDVAEGIEIRPLLADVADDQTETLALGAFAQAPAFGSKGTRRFYIHGGYGLDPTKTENTFAQAGLGVSYFFKDDISINAELNAMYFMQQGHDAYAGNVNVLFRWHFINQQTWSMYGDVGAGLLYANRAVPADGSRFNFTPQAGLGFTFDLGNDARLMTGVRWVHVSNARLYSNNPGREHVYGYAGLSFGF